MAGYIQLGVCQMCNEVVFSGEILLRITNSINIKPEWCGTKRYCFYRLSVIFVEKGSP
ncbi:unnamed protein product [Calypogeia fissa]